MTTEQGKKIANEMRDVGERLTEIADVLEKEKKRMEREALQDTMDKIEAKIRERGYQKVESKIKTYHIGKEVVVRLDDVLELARIEGKKFREGTERGYISKTEEEKMSAYLALNRFRAQLMTGELCVANDFDEHKRILEEHRDRKPVEIPGRYAVGRKYDEENDYWMFFVESKDGKPTFTNRPCMAKLYKRYKDAEACADFMDEDGWEVCDMWEMMSPDDRLFRGVFCDTSDDECNENAIRLNFPQLSDDAR